MADRVGERETLVETGSRVILVTLTMWAFARGLRRQEAGELAGVATAADGE